ncbi:MAG: thioredoxin-disulfide reductase [Rickettsiales bacterium]|jgi:thioredoxin reductase (NADPH)|nr:thioredoxin-disulfide reductase [Rickettsiales bacterium]
MQEYKTKNLIIGSGPAGYTAAIYSARANLKPILVAGMQPGGQLTITTDVENFPGFKDVIQGPWLMQQMEGQAKAVGTEIIYDFITEVDFSKRPFKAKDSSGNTYIAETIIISTGAEAKWLGIESEEFFKGYGVSGCATCDGFFFKNADVFVVGGGNTAVEDALYLTNFATSVTIIHRRDELRAEKMLQDRLFANKKIKFLWDSSLEEVIGDKDPKNVTAIKVKNLKTSKITEHKTSGVFIAIGHKPNTWLFKDYVKMDDENYIITAPDSTATNIKGVFAAGDVQDKTYRQAVTAAGTGCMAALESEKLLNH